MVSPRDRGDAGDSQVSAPRPGTESPRARLRRLGESEHAGRARGLSVFLSVRVRERVRASEREEREREKQGEEGGSVTELSGG